MSSMWMLFFMVVFPNGIWVRSGSIISNYRVWKTWQNSSRWSNWMDSGKPWKTATSNENQPSSFVNRSNVIVVTSWSKCRTLHLDLHFERLKINDCPKPTAKQLYMRWHWFAKSMSEMLTGQLGGSERPVSIKGLKTPPEQSFVATKIACVIE